MTTTCPCGTGHHWGRHGAAGLVLVTAGHILMQRRSRWVEAPGGWSIPGGAIHTNETPTDAAIREALEEVDGITEEQIRPRATLRTVQCRDWSYTVVIADATTRTPVSPADYESDGACWVRLVDVPRMDLHPLLRLTWRPIVRAIETEGSGEKWFVRSGLDRTPPKRRKARP